jgi:hypothetical protein
MVRMTDANLGPAVTNPREMSYAFGGGTKLEQRCLETPLTKLEPIGRDAERRLALFMLGENGIVMDAEATVGLSLR